MSNLPSQAEIKAELAKRRPQNDRELWWFIKTVLGVRIPFRAVCEHHQAPFEWLADVFFERETDTLVRASRDSGKTFMFALLDLLDAHFKPGCGIAHVGSTLKQSGDGYDYLSGRADKAGQDGLARRKPMGDYLASEPIMSATVWNNGSKVQILTGGSDKSVSGPHPNKLHVDEADHWGRATLDTALLMPRSRPEKGLKAGVHIASSQYYNFGLMSELIENADDRGLRLYQWCMLDVMTACPHCPDGREVCPLYEWYNPYTNQMEPLCSGRGALSDGHLPYKDACSKFRRVDPETAALQLLLVGGNRNGLVYSLFIDEAYPAGHIRELPEGPLPDWRFVAGVDLRTHSVIEAVAFAPNGDAYIFDEWSSEKSRPSDTRQAAYDMRLKWWNERGINIEVFWPDPSQPDEIADWPQLAGVPALPAPRRKVMYGVRMIRDGLRNTQGEITLFVSQRCERLRLEWGKLYHLEKDRATGKFNPDKPAKEDDHASDAARYGLASGPLPEGGGVVVYDMEDVEISAY